MSTADFIADLNERYFSGKLSPEFQASLGELPVNRPDVFAFIERMFTFMKRGGMPPTDLSAMHGEILGTLLARILPGAWSGRVPPITVKGRHIAIDHYVKSNKWQPDGPKTMLDLGCGFPPHTTLDTAEFLTDWHITAADPSLPYYLVYDAQGNYATFNEQQEIVYFQPAIPSVENWNALLSDPEATSIMFNNMLEALLSNSEYINTDTFPGVRIDPIQQYQTDSLRFIHGGIGQIDIEPVDVIRCFNVMFYFDDAFHAEALEWMGTQLKEAGTILIGGNWAFSTESHYHVIQKENGNLVHREFAFSIDNLTPMAIVPWYANHDDDRTAALLADYLMVLRQDEEFIKRYYDFHDNLRAEYGICPRDENGYYGGLLSELSPTDLWTGASGITNALSKSPLVEEAAEVMRRAGLKARRNEVGHLAVSK